MGPLKDKTGKAILKVFIQKVNESNRKQKNYGLIKKENFSIKLCKNGQTIMYIIMYSTYIDGKPSITQRFIENL